MDQNQKQSQNQTTPAQAATFTQADVDRIVADCLDCDKEEVRGL